MHVSAAQVTLAMLYNSTLIQLRSIMSQLARSMQGIIWGKLAPRPGLRKKELLLVSRLAAKRAKICRLVREQVHKKEGQNLVTNFRSEIYIYLVPALECN